MQKRFYPIVDAAQRGGKQVKKFFGREFTVAEKTMASDVCTSADLASEKAVITTLEKYFPDHDIYSEEAGMVHKGSKKGIFYIDPLDGTNNFVLGIPYFSTAIVLVENNQTKFAAVYDPVLDLTYWAERGGGAWVGSKKLTVSREHDIERSTVAYAAGYTTPTKIIVSMMGRLRSREVKRVTTNWSPALDFCALASGRIEVIVNLNDQLYDYLGGKLICHEAGAVVSTFSGKLQSKETDGNFIIANRFETHREIVKVLRDFSGL